MWTYGKILDRFLKKSIFLEKYTLFKCPFLNAVSVQWPYQLPLFRGQRWGLHRLVNRVGAAERVVEAIDFLKALVSLLVDALALWHLVEH